MINIYSTNFDQFLVMALILTYLLSCTVSKLWSIIGQIFASDRGVPHFNAFSEGDPCEINNAPATKLINVGPG